jgi:hypothetical protein
MSLFLRVFSARLKTVPVPLPLPACPRPEASKTSRAPKACSLPGGDTASSGHGTPTDRVADGGQGHGAGESLPPTSQVPRHRSQ